MRILATGMLAATVLLTGLLTDQPATAAAPADSGPTLAVPATDLRASLECTAVERGGDAVLLIPGTTLTPEDNFAWNYERAFADAGRAYCTVELPDRAMADIQVSAEYVVAAIRTMAAQTGRKVSILGHSQGGMIGRWALKYWPDTRAKVADLVGLAPSNSGTALADVLCSPDCAPAIWQQRLDSAFLTALNTGPQTFAGVDYTVVYTQTDGVLVPADGSRLQSGDGAIVNIAITDVCPARYADHLTLGTFDAAAYALAVDALDNPGPAAADRFDASTCLQPFQPGVDPATVGSDYTATIAGVGATLATFPHVRAEPELRDYVR